MSVCNAEAYLVEAIESILGQSFTNFEFIIVEDGSNDGTLQILESFRDPRIRLIRNATNSGISYSCNLALQIARAPLIARMDGDDVCSLDRFQIQVDYFQRNPETSVLATSHRIIQPSGQTIGTSEIPDEALLPFVMIWKNCIGQPSIMMKRADLLQVGAYDESFSYAEDYELWCRFLMHGKKIATLPFYSFLRRKSPVRAVFKHKAATECVRRILANYLSWLVEEPLGQDELEAFLKFSRRDPETTIADFQNARGLVRRLYQASRSKSLRALHPNIRKTFSTQLLHWADLLELHHAPGAWRIIAEAFCYSPNLQILRKLYHLRSQR